MKQPTLNECNSAYKSIAEELRALGAGSVQTEAERIARHQRFMELMRRHKQINERWRDAFVERHALDFSSLATKSPLTLKRNPDADQSG